jgi:hypothetical protein
LIPVSIGLFFWALRRSLGRRRAPPNQPIISSSHPAP